MNDPYARKVMARLGAGLVLLVIVALIWLLSTFFSK